MPIRDRKTLNEGKELILKAVPRRVGEGVETYLWRVHEETGIGYWCLRQGWKNERLSKKNELLLTGYKEEKEAGDNVDNLLGQLKAIASQLEETARRPRSQNRKLAASLRDCAERFKSLDRSIGHTHRKALKLIPTAIAAAAALEIVMSSHGHAIWF